MGVVVLFCDELVSGCFTGVKWGKLLLVVAVHVVVYHGSTFVASELFLVADCSNVVHECYCSAPLECGMTLVVRTSHRSVEVPLR
jgi:hypothetical protein